MAGYQQMSGERIRQLEEIAQLAEASLTRYGFRATEIADNSGLGGATVEVDTGDDESGGVYVHWEIPRDLNDECIRLAFAGDLTHPLREQMRTIRDLMFDVIMSALSSDGFEVVPSDNDMNPGAMRITGMRVDRESSPGASA
jgi:hypothetical protein